MPTFHLGPFILAVNKDDTLQTVQFSVTEKGVVTSLIASETLKSLSYPVKWYVYDPNSIPPVSCCLVQMAADKPLLRFDLGQRDGKNVFIQGKSPAGNNQWMFTALKNEGDSFTTPLRADNFSLSVDRCFVPTEAEKEKICLTVPQISLKPASANESRDFIDTVFHEMSIIARGNSTKYPLSELQHNIIKHILYFTWKALEEEVGDDAEGYYQTLLAIVNDDVNNSTCPPDYCSHAKEIRTYFAPTAINRFEGIPSQFRAGRFYLDAEGKEAEGLSAEVSIADVYRYMTATFVLAAEKLQRSLKKEQTSIVFTNPPEFTEGIKVGTLRNPRVRHLTRIEQDRFNNLRRVLITSNSNFLKWHNSLYLYDLIQLSQELITENYSDLYNAARISDYLTSIFFSDERFSPDFNWRVMLQNDVMPKIFFYWLMNFLSEQGKLSQKLKNFSVNQINTIFSGLKTYLSKHCLDQEDLRQLRLSTEEDINAPDENTTIFYAGLLSILEQEQKIIIIDKLLTQNKPTELILREIFIYMPTIHDCGAAMKKLSKTADGQKKILFFIQNIQERLLLNIISQYFQDHFILDENYLVTFSQNQLQLNYLNNLDDFCLFLSYLDKDDIAAVINVLDTRLLNLLFSQRPFDDFCNTLSPLQQRIAEDMVFNKPNIFLNSLPDIKTCVAEFRKMSSFMMALNESMLFTEVIQRRKQVHAKIYPAFLINATQRLKRFLDQYPKAKINDELLMSMGVLHDTHWRYGRKTIKFSHQGCSRLGIDMEGEGVLYGIVKFYPVCAIFQAQIILHPSYDAQDFRIRVHALECVLDECIHYFPGLSEASLITGEPFPKLVEQLLETLEQPREYWMSVTLPNYATISSEKFERALAVVTQFSEDNVIKKRCESLLSIIQSLDSSRLKQSFVIEKNAGYDPDRARKHYRDFGKSKKVADYKEFGNYDVSEWAQFNQEKQKEMVESWLKDDYAWVSFTRNSRSSEQDSQFDILAAEFLMQEKLEPTNEKAIKILGYIEVLWKNTLIDNEKERTYPFLIAWIGLCMQKHDSASVDQLILFIRQALQSESNDLMSMPVSIDPNEKYEDNYAHAEFLDNSLRIKAICMQKFGEEWGAWISRKLFLPSTAQSQIGAPPAFLILQRNADSPYKKKVMAALEKYIENYNKKWNFKFFHEKNFNSVSQLKQVIEKNPGIPDDDLQDMIAALTCEGGKNSKKIFESLARGMPVERTQDSDKDPGPGGG